MRHLKFAIIILILLLIIPAVAADGTWTVDLVAGQHTTIGTVSFTIAGDTLEAVYQVTSPGWCMSTTQFYAGDTEPDRAAPGQFPYKHEGLDCVTSDSYSVPVPSGDVFVAAHADTSFDPDRADSEPSELNLEGIGTLTVSGSTSSYFTATVTGAIEGSFAAWCVDLSHYISTGVSYTAYMHDSTQDLTGIVDRPENMDLVNYIINQDYPAQGYNPYNVQVAIWLLIDDTTPGIITSEALAIKADAEANGEGFVPGPGDKMGIIFEPIENNAQHIFVVYEIPVAEGPVEGSPRAETAWGLADWGIAFDQGWGMYFQLVSAGDEPPADDPIPDDPDPEPAPATPEPPRARNEEAPGQNANNSAPGSRRAEAPGQNGQGNRNGQSQNNRGNGGG